MRLASRSGLAVCVVVACVISSCGKDPGGAAAPRPDPAGTRAEPKTEGAADTQTGEIGETGETGEPEPRLELETEFHRTRFGLGTGMWVLGIVHNPHAEPITDIRVRVRLLDETEVVVGRAEGRVRRRLGPGARAGVAVLVTAPVVHEQLRLIATAIIDDAPAPEPLPLRLVHGRPERADFGGWLVRGHVANSGPDPFKGARIEIQGLDKSGKLLGIDWLDLSAVPSDDTLEFEVGDLRYEESPEQFSIELRGPALD